MEFDYIHVTGQKKSSNKSKQILLKGSFFWQTRDGVVLAVGYSHASGDRSTKSRAPILMAFTEAHECLEERMKHLPLSKLTFLLARF